MKRFISIMSVISLLTAAIALVLNIKVLFGGSIMFGFMMFSMIRSGSFMGYIGSGLAYHRSRIWRNGTFRSAAFGIQ